jgi:hypothetical protein
MPVTVDAEMVRIAEVTVPKGFWPGTVTAMAILSAWRPAGVYCTSGVSVWFLDVVDV